jgi:hypothetical protein
MKRNSSLEAILFAATMLFAVTTVAAAQSSPAVPPAGGMARTGHEWQGAGRSSSFDVLWIGGEMKMIREEVAPVAGIVEKNEYVFNGGKLLHFKQDRYPESGKSGESVATMVSFDKNGNPAISMRRIDGKPAGTASPAEIAQSRKHLDELLAITSKVRH